MSALSSFILTAGCFGGHQELTSFSFSTFPLSYRGVVKTDSCLKWTWVPLKTLWVLLLAAAILYLAARKWDTIFSPKSLQTHPWLQFSHRGSVRTLIWFVQEYFSMGVEFCLQVFAFLLEPENTLITAAWVVMAKRSLLVLELWNKRQIDMPSAAAVPHPCCSPPPAQAMRCRVVPSLVMCWGGTTQVCF